MVSPQSVLLMMAKLISKSKPTDNGSFPEPEQRQRWVILLAAHFCFLLWEGLSKSLGVLLSSAKEQFGTETWTVGFSIGMMLTFRGFSGPLLWVLQDKFPYHHVAFVCGLVAGIGVIAASFSTNVLQFAVCLVLFPGLAFGLILNTSLVLLGQQFEHMYACANGIAYSGLSVGIIIFAPLSQLLLDTYGWQGALLLIGGIQLHLAVLGSLLRQTGTSSRIQHVGYVEVKTDSSPLKQDNDKEIRNGEQDRLRDPCNNVFKKFIKATDLDLFSELSYITLIACMSNVCFVNIAWLVYTVPHILVKGLNVYSATVIVWSGAIGILVGQLGHGLLIDFNVISGRTMMYAANVVMGLALMCDPFLYGIWPLIVSNFIFGIGLGIMLPLTYTMMREAVGVARMTNALGWAELAGGVFRISASIFTGWFYDRTGSYDLAFILLGSLSGLVILILITEDVFRSIQRRRPS